MKKCPFCAEEIQEEAMKCKHCGEWLNKIKNSQITENINEVTAQNLTTKLFTEDNVQLYEKDNSKESKDDSDKTFSERLSILDKVEKSFKKLKWSIVVICFLPTIFGVVAANISPLESSLNILIPLFLILLIILACFVFYYLWHCARLVERNPMIYILVSILIPITIGSLLPAGKPLPGWFILPIIGIIIAYNVLKKAAVKQGLVKFSINKRWWQF